MAQQVFEGTFYGKTSTNQGKTAGKQFSYRVRIVAALTANKARWSISVVTQGLKKGTFTFACQNEPGWQTVVESKASESLLNTVPNIDGPQSGLKGKWIS